MLTRQELAILPLEPGDALPSGGRIVHGRTFSGSGTAKDHTDLFLAAFRRRWGIELEPGSLNVQLDSPTEWEGPCTLLPGTSWEFIPVIINDEQAIGVAFRGNRVRSDLLEIASPIKLRTRLGCPEPMQAQVAVRLLSGALLEP